MSELMLGTDSGWVEIASLILRVFLGFCFIIHGLGKLGVVGPGNMDGFTSWLKGMGIPFPGLFAKGAMLSELFGGVFLLFGLLTRPFAAILIVVMLVATFMGHKGGGYLITNDPPGHEYALNLAAVLFVLILLGPGPYSLDALIF